MEKKLVVEERREEAFAEERSEKRECFRKREKKIFNFLNEGQNLPFNKLLGAPAILLGAPSISLSLFSSLPTKLSYFSLVSLLLSSLHFGPLCLLVGTWYLHL